MKRGKLPDGNRREVQTVDPKDTIDKLPIADSLRDLLNDGWTVKYHHHHKHEFTTDSVYETLDITLHRF